MPQNRERVPLGGGSDWLLLDCFHPVWTDPNKIENRAFVCRRTEVSIARRLREIRAGSVVVQVQPLLCQGVNIRRRTRARPPATPAHKDESLPTLRLVTTNAWVLRRAWSRRPDRQTENADVHQRGTAAVRSDRGRPDRLHHLHAAPSFLTRTAITTYEAPTSPAPPTWVDARAGEGRPRRRADTGIRVACVT